MIHSLLRGRLKAFGTAFVFAWLFWHKTFYLFFKFATGWILVEDPYSKTFDFWGCANCAYFKPKHLSICFKKTAITFFVSVKWQMIVNSDSYISLLCIGHLIWELEETRSCMLYMLEEQGHPSRGTFAVTFFYFFIC